MKKLSSKTKLSIILCLIAVITFGGIKIYGELGASGGEIQADTKTVNLELVDENVGNALSSIVKNNNLNTEATSQDLVKFMEWVKVYNPTEEAQKTVARLIDAGADVDALIAVCVFWEDTDEPFSIVEQIYSRAPIEDFDEIDDHILWIEGTYNALTGREDEALTIEEVKAYVADGISTSDIRIANRMSRKADNDINVILNERKEGKSWYELIVTSDEALLPENHAELGGNNLLDAKIIAEKTGVSLTEVMQDTEELEDGELLYTFRQEKTIEAVEELTQMGLITETYSR